MGYEINFWNKVLNNVNFVIAYLNNVDMTNLKLPGILGECYIVIYLI